jgi:LDH2 family malate/lactate/ureidoglycolate dehydrogenase
MNQLIVHGHFYQPPRENPWTGKIDDELSAAPYPNWNARILAELRENGLSQVFIAFNASSLNPNHTASRIADQVVEYFQLPPNSAGERVRYPGQRVLATRKEHLANGIPVQPSIWQQLDSL